MNISLKNILGASALLLVASTNDSHAVLIDFDTGINGNLVNSFYSGSGVQFANAQWAGNFGLTGSSGALGIRAPGTYQWLESNAVVALFTPYVTSVSIVGLDIGSQGIGIKAYDSFSGGSLLSSSTQVGIGSGIGSFFTVSVSGAGIKRVEVFQLSAGGGDGMLLDNLQFTAGAPSSGVPDGGSSIALLGLAMTAVAGARRKFGV